MSQINNKPNKTDNIASGTMFIGFAKVFWLIAGYILTFTLPRLISVESYGTYGVVGGAMNVLNMVVIMGALQGVSRFVSADENQAKAIHKLSLKVLLVLGGSMTLLYFLLSTFGVIGGFLNDSSLTPYLQITALITLFYSFYSVNVGYLNGMRKFKQQAFLDMFFVSFKAICMLSFAYFGIHYLNSNGLTEAFGGFAFAAFVVLSISFFVMKFNFEKVECSYTFKDIASFIITIMAFTFVLNLLMNTDLFLVKKLISGNSSEQVGYYTGALTISRIPYALMMTISLVIFPLISKLTSIGDREKSKKYIENALKYPFVLLLGIAVVISSNSELVVKFILGNKYVFPAPTGEILNILVFAILGLAIFTLSTTIISGSGKPNVSLGIGIITLAIDISINYLFIPKFNLVGAAFAKCLSLSIGVTLCMIYLWKTQGAYLKPFTVLRSGLVTAFLLFLSTLYFPEGILLGLAKIAVFGILFFALIFVVGEFKIKDVLALVKK